MYYFASEKTTELQLQREDAFTKPRRQLQKCGDWPYVIGGEARFVASSHSHAHFGHFVRATGFPMLRRSIRKDDLHNNVT